MPKKDPFYSVIFYERLRKAEDEYFRQHPLRRWSLGEGNGKKDDPDKPRRQPAPQTHNSYDSCGEAMSRDTSSHE